MGSVDINRIEQPSISMSRTMPEEYEVTAVFDAPANYEICVFGLLDGCWESSFDGLAMTYREGITCLRGPVVDQSALHGLFRRIRDLGLPLISVVRLSGESSARSGFEF